MITLSEFKESIKKLDGLPALNEGVYQKIEVNDYCISFNRKNKSNREFIVLDELYKVYPDFNKLGKVEINKRLRPGNHWAPSNCFLKAAGLLK